jgi:hypothetical protein
MRAWYNRAVRFALSVLAATLVIATAAGCSGTSTSSTTPTATRPTPQPTQSRWAKQVDAACKPWQKRIDSVSPAPTNSASLQAWLKRALPFIRKQIVAVDAVKPPPKQAEARKATRFLDSVQKTERALTRYLAAVRANVPAKARAALADANASGRAARAAALSLNITQCGGYESR